MKTHISYIGVLDKIGNQHFAYLKEGLNVITGKSSTGKSAIIEIFDYCMGSSENTIPQGIITRNAAIYFVVLYINDKCVVLARDPLKSSKAFYKHEITDECITPEVFDKGYFSDSHFIPLPSFLKKLRSDFLDINDVDESLALREIKGRKAPTPSVRSFTSFMLQHQNLVANKHALFYRFDEKEKRDQAIDHIKIFLGIVTQEYFHLKQELESLKAEEKSIRLDIERSNKQVDRLKARIEPSVIALCAAVGLDKPPMPINQIMLHPQDAKEKINAAISSKSIKPLSDANFLRFNELDKQVSEKTAAYRRVRNKLNTIDKSIVQSGKFTKATQALETLPSVSISQSICPFCQTSHDHLHSYAEELRTAIKRVNHDLSHTSTMTATLESAKQKVSREAKELKDEIHLLTVQRDEIEQQNKDLESHKTLYEIVLKQKVLLDVLLDNISTPLSSDAEKLMGKLRERIGSLKSKLKEYNVAQGMKEASEAVNSIMLEIGSKFDFEESYQPIKLKFSFETFDLYHEVNEGEKVFLRSMGSGANWVYSHVTLFLALHRYFASLGDACAIPTVLFLDQPTQVYFPSFKFDTGSEFSTEEIQKIEQRGLSDKAVDDDIVSVENLFSQLSIFCTETKRDTGIMPQVIVTDHADYLTLSDGTDFESLVNGNRWRTHGLINPVPDNE